MHSVCLMTNAGGRVADKQIRRTIEIISDKGMHPYCVPEEAKLLGLEAFSPGTHTVDFAVVLGGDGTVLHASRYFARWSIPILGVNLGTLGFMDEIMPEELENALDLILAGQYGIEHRTMLCGSVEKGANSDDILALNEIGFFREIEGGVVHISVYENGGFLGTYSCDGIMISTPTGSTAYSLSAGGPIVEPSVKCFLLVPVCAHSLYARPIVLPDTAQIKMVVQGARDRCKVLADDQKQASAVRRFQSLLIRKSEYETQFIRLNQKNYFEQLRKKLAEWNTPQWEDHCE